MMLATLVLMALIGVAALALLLRGKAKPEPVRRDAAPQPSSAPALPATPAPLPPRDDTVPLAALHRPAPLALRSAALLDAAASAPLMEALRRLPRPPRALEQLMSPQFVQTASSAELASIVMGEPAVAARVIATVNSPLYALQQPVHSIGQATTFLGLASVRRLCLQYLLAESFKPRDAAQQREFEILWRASSTAGELCQHLAQRLRLPEPGALATLLVLSFLGRQAAVALLPEAGALKGLDGHQRALHEQAELGLAAHELGLLLMQAWELPPDMAGEAHAISALQFDPGLSLPAGQATALTLCAVCAVLGERAARGQFGEAGFDPVADKTPEIAALRHRLVEPPLLALGGELRTPAVLRLLGKAR